MLVQPDGSDGILHRRVLGGLHARAEHIARQIAQLQRAPAFPAEGERIAHARARDIESERLDVVDEAMADQDVVGDQRDRALAHRIEGWRVAQVSRAYARVLCEVVAHVDGRHVDKAVEEDTLIGVRDDAAACERRPTRA